MYFDWKYFKLSDNIRYVAVYKNGQLESKSKSSTLGASSSESDRYEELLVNPTLIKLASQHGNIDCGDPDYILVRYGNIFQFVLPENWDHVSVCVEANADPIQFGAQIKSMVHSASWRKTIHFSGYPLGALNSNVMSPYSSNRSLQIRDIKTCDI